MNEQGEKKMKEKLDNMYWKWQFNMMENTLRDEKGASDMVTVIVLIVIVLAVAAIFREQLISIVNNVLEKLTDFIG